MPFFIQSVLNIIHGTAYQVALCVGLAEVYSKRYFGKLGAHAEQRRDTQYQNTAPGPPIAIAPATPATLPVPTVAARAVHTAWKGVRAPSEASFFLHHTSQCHLHGIGEFSDLKKTRPDT